MFRRVLYACTQDPLDVGAWSGTIHHMLGALQSAFEFVEPWQIPGAERPFYSRLQGALSRRVFRSLDAPESEPWFARHCSAAIAQRLTAGEFDAVFTHAPRTIAYLEGEKPAFAFSDAVWPNLIDYYPGFDRIRPRTTRDALETERRGVSRCTHFFVSSEWARRAALSEYELPSNRVEVIRLGANLKALDADPTNAALSGRLQSPIRLLFVGVEWDRKGGDVAVEAARQLNERGQACELIVVGADPPPTARKLPFVRAIGFLDKRKPAEMERLIELLDSAAVLLMPSRAEAYGIAAVEAFARAVPALVADTGGLGELVAEGETGYRLPLADPGAGYADRVAGLVREPTKYAAMCRAALDAARSEFDWPRIGIQIKAAMERPAD